MLDRALKILDEMPKEYKDFYARRMVSRIQNKAYSKDKSHSERKGNGDGTDGSSSDKDEPSGGEKDKPRSDTSRPSGGKPSDGKDRSSDDARRPSSSENKSSGGDHGKQCSKTTSSNKPQSNSVELAASQLNSPNRTHTDIRNSGLIDCDHGAIDSQSSTAKTPETQSSKPHAVLVFSGKRKSGKDYVTDIIRERLGTDVCSILRLSGPLKEQYAKVMNLDTQY